MKDIGIVTFWDSQDNYGQVLQCFASQKYLRMQGNNAFLIRYLEERDFVERDDECQSKRIGIIEKLINPIYWRFFIRTKWKTIHDAFINLFILNHNVNRCFDNFREEYIIGDLHIYNSEELRKNPPKADIYMVGSDMVWGQVGHYPIYFLDFGSNGIRRYALAASFGRTLESITENEKLRLKQLLASFDGITLREEEGVRICSELGYHESRQICDPTMLVPNDCYEDIVNTIQVPDLIKKQVFLYYLNSDPSHLTDKQIINYFQEQLQTVNYAPSQGVVNTIPKIFPTIPEWLAYIKESSFVVTNSFHGCVFCLLFKKQFAVIPLCIEERNTRIESLLVKLDLLDRICYDVSSLSYAYSRLINYDIVTSKLECFRNYSRELLSQMVEGKVFQQQLS